MFDPARLESLEHRLLEALVAYHLEYGIHSPEYLNRETGGIYEHKLAADIGIPNTRAGHATPEVVAACDALAEKGLVRRNLRKPDFPVAGIRPTQLGITTAHYWSMPWYKKAAHWTITNWTQWVLPVTLTLLTQWLAVRMGLR